MREEGTPLPYSFTPDGVTDASFLGIRTAKAISPTEIHSDYHGEKVWKLSQDISSFPKFSTENNLLIETLYNMALEEMLMDVRSDSTFRAGALWPDTWTRDAVYSIWFSYAWIMPEVSRKTLDKQTLRNPREPCRTQVAEVHGLYRPTVWCGHSLLGSTICTQEIVRGSKVLMKV